MVLKTHLEPFREPLKVPPVGQPKNPFFLRVYISLIFYQESNKFMNQDIQKNETFPNRGNKRK